MNSAHEKRGVRSRQRGTRASLAANRRSGAAKYRTLARRHMTLATVIGWSNTSLPIEDQTPDREHRARSRKRGMVIASRPTSLYNARPLLCDARFGRVGRAPDGGSERSPDASRSGGDDGRQVRRSPRTAGTGTSRDPRHEASEL